MSAVQRLVGAFIAPAPPSAARTRHAPEPPWLTVVLGDARSSLLVGAAIALRLRAAHGAGAAVLAADPAMPAIPRALGTRAIATAAARRLAQRLAARDIDAEARGALAVVQLPGTLPARALERLTGALPETPVICALATPRDPWHEPVVREADLAVTVMPADAAAALAAALTADSEARTDVVVPFTPRPLAGPPRRLPDELGALIGRGRP